jgi:hypothetical protein
MGIYLSSGVAKNILLFGTAEEHRKFPANNKVNRHSDIVTV